MERSANAAGIIRHAWGRTRDIPRFANAATKRSAKSKGSSRDAAHRLGPVSSMIVPRRLRWLWLTLAVVFLDRATKAWFETQTAEGWRHELVHHFLYLVRASNPGIAFSFFADSTSHWTRILLIAGSVVVIALLAWFLVASS